MGAHLIVDGYNLARSGSLSLDRDPVTPEGRDELCGLLAGYAREKGLRLTVVFDGAGPERSRTAFKGGTALFSAARESADDVIRDLARGAPAGTVVVTSDRGLAGTLPSRAVAVVSGPDFAERLFAFRLESIKGGTGEERDRGVRGGEKKGAGRRLKKGERKRIRALRKL